MGAAWLLGKLSKSNPLTWAALRHSLYRSGVLDAQWDEAGFGVIDKEPVMVLGASRKTSDPFHVQPTEVAVGIESHGHKLQTAP